MKSWPTPLLLLLVACGHVPDDAKQRSGTLHENTSEAFQVELPPGWAAQDTPYELLGDCEVFCLIRNSQAKGITPRLTARQQSISRRLWGHRPFPELLDQLPDGGVIVMLWRFQGGPPVWCNFGKDTVGDSLTQLVASLHLGWRRLDDFHFGFIKWSRGWAVDILARRPARADRQDVDTMLKSIVFPRVPVILAGQAEQLAFRELPSDALTLCPRENALRLEVAVTESDSAFLVQFHPCRTCNINQSGSTGQAPVRGWSYRVQRNGAVARYEETAGARDAPNTYEAPVRQER